MYKGSLYILGSICYLWSFWYGHSDKFEVIILVLVCILLMISDIDLFFNLGSTYQLCHLWIFSPILIGCLFVLSMVSFAVQTLFSLIQSHLLIFAFISFALGNISKSIATNYVKDFYAYDFHRIFMVFSLTFRSLIHFLHSVRKYSKFILLHVAVQSSRYHLLTRLSFFTDYFCLPCHRLIDHKCMSLFLGSLFCSIDLYVCFVPVWHCFDYYIFEV